MEWNGIGMAMEWHRNGMGELASRPTDPSTKGNLMIKHNTQIFARGIQSILDKYNTAEGCIPCKGDPKRKL